MCEGRRKLSGEERVGAIDRKILLAVVVHACACVSYKCVSARLCVFRLSVRMSSSVRVCRTVVCVCATPVCVNPCVWLRACHASVRVRVRRGGESIEKG